MYVPAAPTVPPRTAPPPPSCPPPPVLLTAQQAEQSIELIQRELLRLLRACEFREQHPHAVSKGIDYSNNSASAQTTSTSASPRHDPTRPSLSNTEPNLKLAPSTTSFPPDPHRTDAADAAATTTPMAASLSGASFSAFERRRIAHLLGRVALEIAALWTYVHQGDPLCGDSPAADTMSVSSALTTAHGTARLPSDRKTATPAATLASSTADGGRGSAAAAVSLGSAETGAALPVRMRHSVWGGAAKERPGARNSDPAVQLAGLHALIETAAAIQRSHRKAGGGGWGGSAAPADDGDAGTAGSLSKSAPPGATQAIPLALHNTSFDGVGKADQEVGDAIVGWECGRGSLGVAASLVAVAPQFPASLLTACQTTVPKGVKQNSGESEATLPAAHDRTVSHQAPRSSGRAKQSSAAGSSIPIYLRAYVFDDDNDGCGGKIGDSGNECSMNDSEGDTRAQLNADMRVPHRISSGSGHTRSLSRASEPLVTSHDDSCQTRPSSARFAMESAARTSRFSAAAPDRRPSLLGSAATSLTAPANVGGSGGAAITVAELLDADPASHSSSLHIRRALSASSLHFASLTSSPLQRLQSSAHASPGYSGGSASSQPNASVSHRSPDSVEVLPAATAAYLRSKSLFRRPHRLEVPVSRTQSLRHAPSVSSPVSASGISLVLAPGVVHPGGTLAAASGAYGSSSATSSHMAKSSSGAQLSSGGAVHWRTSSHLASFPPVAMGASTTVDSPRSSVAGLHFKRVVSLDSDGGLWPQGSLADSLEMSPQKMASMPGRTSASAMEATRSSPLPPDAGLTTSPGSHRDEFGAFTSPSDGQPEGVMPGAVPFSGHHSSALPPGRTELSHSLSAQSCLGTLNPPVSSTSAATASSAVLGSSPSRLRPLSLLSPTRFDLSSQRRAHAAKPALTSFSPAPATTDGLTPYSYLIEDEILTEFLRCVHDLRQANLTDAEFDSLQLRYFLPGVSLTTPSATAQSPSPLPSPSAPPLPLFEGGELLPLHRGSLGVFCSLVRERLAAVCRHLHTSASPYLALL
ncbi:hypothetical protein LSCM1_04402 [Leishmania martiniquensis]|uniref:Uncharacterized protein n=1 Tax=Leishmania martiniquensis TaxID=1580590 RepID=A0A836G2F4_9TRYP|nr:hypothetical protein LSCM1_04402 [Leishmania martiniquensis]